jgi:hypothetical protein
MEIGKLEERPPPPILFQQQNELLRERKVSRMIHRFSLE